MDDTRVDDGGGSVEGLDGFDWFDTSDPRWADPHPNYHRLRAAAPRWLAPEGALMLTTHADCMAVLRDPRWSSNTAHRTTPVEEVSAVDPSRADASAGLALGDDEFLADAQRVSIFEVVDRR